MGEIKICAVCKRRIAEREFDEGLVVERAGKLLCQECGGQKKTRQDDQVLMLESILKEVKSINRALAFEEASIWNILGAVVQCFVFGALVFAYLRGAGGGQESMLLLAILFQLMALTFFTLKR